MFALAALNPMVAVALDNLIQLAVFVAVPVVAVLGFKLIKYLETKLGINIDDAYEAKLQEIMHSGVLRAGEWARSKVALGEGAPESAKKMEAAIEFVKAELERQGYDKMAEDKIRMLLEAALASKRAEQAPLVAVPNTDGTTTNLTTH
jgi:hypothetical protein